MKNSWLVFCKKAAVAGLAGLFLLSLMVLPMARPVAAVGLINPGGSWNYLTASPDQVSQGTIVCFDFSFTTNVETLSQTLQFIPNPNPGPGEPLAIVDVSPGLRIDAGAGQVMIVWPDMELPAGAELSGYAHFRVVNPQPNSTIAVTARFTLMQPDGFPLNPENYVNLTVPGGPLGPLTIIKQADRSQINAGDSFNYNITITNPNDQPVSNIRVVDSLDGYLIPQVGQIGGPSITGNTLTWTLRDPLGPREQYTISLAVQVSPSAPDGYQINNTARVSAAGLPDNQDSALPVLVRNAPAPVYTLTMGVNPTAVAPGGTFRHTISFSSNNNPQITQAFFQVVLPSNVVFVAAGGGGVLNGSTVQWFVGNVYPNQSLQMTLDLQVAANVPAGTTIINSVNFQGRTNPGNLPINTSAQSPAVTVTAPQFTFSQKVDPANAAAGSKVTFTVIANNVSNSSVANAVLVYTLDPNLTTPSFSPLPSSQSGNTYTWNIGYLSAQQVFQMIVSVTIAPGVTAGKTLTNMAVFTASGSQFSSSAGVYISSTPPPPVINFPDVPSFYWAYNEIMAMVKAGVVNGYPDRTFKPELPVTRAEFCKMIDLAMGYTIPASISRPPFPDLSPDDAWAWPYIQVALDKGLVTGFPDGTFRPRESVTEAQIFAIITRAQGWPLVNPVSASPLYVAEEPATGIANYDLRPFTAATCWYYQYVGTAIQYGILKVPDDPHQITWPDAGPGTYTYYFNTSAFRAETAVFLDRMMGGR
ncbi:MAG: S-layer homology domain-containing protein [Coprothermobacterota bacterium]|nr:S-layer homology domain-containing protein [Coprothermobacterota bacterium]